MKKYGLLISILVFTILHSSAQIALSLDAAQNRGIEVESLDSLYKSGVHSDPNQAVFAEEQNDYIKSYYAMLHDLSEFLNTNEFRWGGITRCFNRIYFNENGTVDYYIYEFEEGQLSVERQEEFEQLLNEFIVDYQFPLTKNVKFAQCSAANYRDVL